MIRMIGIIKKNAPFFLINLLVLVIALFAYWKTSRTALDVTVVFIQVAWLYGVVLLSVMGDELREANTDGYSFLATLPVTAGEIVAAKYVLVLMIAAVYTICTYFMFAGLEVDPAVLALSRGYLFANGVLCLVLSGIMYLGFFRFGCRRFYKVLMGFVIVIFLSPFLLEEIAIPRVDVTLATLIALNERIPWTVVVPAGLAVYLGLMILAMRVKRRFVTAAVCVLLAVQVFSGCGGLRRGGVRAPAGPLLSTQEQQLNIESFETVWRTIRDGHFDPGLGGIDWQYIQPVRGAGVPGACGAARGAGPGARGGGRVDSRTEVTMPHHAAAGTPHRATPQQAAMDCSMNEKPKVPVKEVSDA